eukprot:335115-Rhodomonas_salina.1
MSALPVGNEAARDDKKHCAAFILRSAICEVIPSVGALLIVHYDKRGAKVTMEYAGEDCELNATVLELGGGEKQKVEDKASEICEYFSSSCCRGKLLCLLSCRIQFLITGSKAAPGCTSSSSPLGRGGSHTCA